MVTLEQFTFVAGRASMRSFHAFMFGNSSYSKPSMAHLHQTGAVKPCSRGASRYGRANVESKAASWAVGL
jgi:hypothetical protein